jgi:hypothetical protein
MQESQKFYVNGTEVKVGQIWELRENGIRVKIDYIEDDKISAKCLQSGPMWSEGETNEWYNEGRFYMEEDSQHDLFKLIKDAEPALTLSEKIAIMQAAQNGATVLVDGVPTKVEDCTWDWSNHSYKVDTRKSISYRVALMCSDGRNYATLLHSQDAESMFRANPIFVRWLTDWNTVYIDEDDKA